MHRGYAIRVGGPHPDGVVQIWHRDELVDRTRSVDAAIATIDEWHEAP